MLSRILEFGFLSLTLGLSTGLLWADDADDGPGRGVARISLMNGDVSVRRGDSGDFVAGALNAPLVVQDRVLTGINSRAEVQFDWANMIRIASNAEIRLAELEHRRYIIQIARGTVTFRVLRDIDADVELSTPSVAVRPVKKGSYRVSVHEDGSSEITVRSGEAEIFTPTGSERLRDGRTMFARGSASDPEFRITGEVREDDWDRWNRDRDRDLERTSSYRYVSPDIYGAEDLDHHGSWVHAHDHGWLWAPRVAVGWAPYRYGRWSWIDWYGWTWISHDPWGWAPYHYGRWLYRAPYGWCWSPGVVHSRHFWSPALVAFVGFGRGVGVGVGWGHVGWIPLGPREPLHRWWGSRYYANNRNNFRIDNSVNIVQNVNITNVYRNARIQNAVTAVDRDGFSRGRLGNAIRFGEGDFSRANLVQGHMPVVPERDSLRLANRDVATPNQGRSPDRFYGRRTAAQVERVPFEEQRRGIEQVARRTFGEEAPARAAGSEVPGRPSEASPGPGDAGGRGWRRVGEAPGSGERTSPSSASEWRRFGTPRTADSGSSAVMERGERSGRFGEPATGRSFDGGAALQAPDRSSSNSNSATGPQPGDGRSSGRGSGEEWRRFGSGSSGSGPANQSTDPVRGQSRAERTSERFDGSRRGGSDDSGRGNSQVESGRSAPSVFERNERPSSRAERGGDNGRSERQGRASGGGEPVQISPPMVRDRGDRGGGGADRSGGERSTASAPPSAPRVDMGGGGRAERSSGAERIRGGEAQGGFGGRGGRSGR